jgi:hypothetical protein
MYDLIDSLLVTDHTAKTTDGEDQLFCPRHNINVWKFATSICRCVLQGAPIEFIGYRYSSGAGVYVCRVQCAKRSHTAEEVFSACMLCLRDMLDGHPKAMRKAAIAEWEYQERFVLNEADPEESS